MENNGTVMSSKKKKGSVSIIMKFQEKTFERSGPHFERILTHL